MTYDGPTTPVHPSVLTEFQELLMASKGGTEKPQVPPGETILLPPEEPYEPGRFVQSEFAVFIRTAYNYDKDKVSDETGLECKDPSLADQSAKEEVDINEIVRRFGLTGQLPANVRIPQYGDFTGINDYQEALNAIDAADEAFMSLPADVRKRFDNDPGAFVDFCSDENNREEMEKMGLLKEPKREETPPVATQQGEEASPGTIKNK